MVSSVSLVHIPFRHYFYSYNSGTGGEVKLVAREKSVSSGHSERSVSIRGLKTYFIFRLNALMAIVIIVTRPTNIPAKAPYKSKGFNKSKKK